MKKKHYIFLLLLILILISGGLLFQQTLAKYRKKVDQQIGINLARWNIKLNNESIAGKNTISSEITPIFDQSEYVAENVIAPGISGYFEIMIDAKDVDVSFNYNLTIVPSDIETYPDIKVVGYTIDPDNSQEVIDYTDKIEGTIAHNTELTKIKIYIKWDDSETNTMTNADDTNVVINNSEITMQATFTFEQINI